MFHYLVVRAQCMIGNKKAQGMVEYALILAFVVVLAVALTNAGGISEKIKAVFTKVGTELDKGK